MSSLQSFRTLAPRRLELSLSPVEVAGRLRRLEGFFFLDSASSELGLAESTPGAISIIGALPDLVIRGDIATDQEALRAPLAEMDQPTVADWGLPSGGLFGTVDFDGSFCFGRYRQLLIYRHDRGDWFGVGGGLADHLGDLGQTRVAEVSFSADIGRQEFCAMVRRAKEYIAAGDIYQVNLAQRFDAPWEPGACLLYTSPSPRDS